MLLCITERGRPSITWTRRPARMCVRVQCARGLIVCRWRGSPQGFSVVVWKRWRRGGGELEALRVDVMQAKHLETRTLTGVKRGRVIYLAGGRGRAGKALGDRVVWGCQAGWGYLVGWGSWE